MDRIPRRLGVEVVLTAALSACAALVVFLVGAHPVALPPPRVPAFLRSEPGCHEATVAQLAGSNIGGEARLCIRDEGIHVTLEAENLTAGTAYTTWLGYFDNADSCGRAICRLEDLAGDDPIGVLGRMDGRVAAWPRETFAADYRDLRTSPGSEVLVWVFSHGPSARSGDYLRRARQLLTPQSPGLGAPLVGARSDGALGQPVAQAVFRLRRSDE